MHVIGGHGNRLIEGLAKGLLGRADQYRQNRLRHVQVGLEPEATDIARQVGVPAWLNRAVVRAAPS